MASRTFFRVLVIAVGILTVLPSYRFLAKQDAETSEYHALLLFSIAGQCLMAASNDLIMVFIGLEISSIASYVMAGYLRDDKRNNESALKYFLLGSFATAFFLYGVALIYGVTRQREPGNIRAAVLQPDAPIPSSLGRGRGADVRRPRRSKFPRLRSRFGRPTSIRARPLRSRHSCPPDRRPPPSLCSCASS